MSGTEGGFVRVELDRVEAAVEATDWSAHAVVDVVEFLPGTTGFEDDRWRTEVYRYEGPAPPASVYENGDRRYRVRRVTRPLLDRLRPE